MNLSRKAVFAFVALLLTTSNVTLAKPNTSSLDLERTRTIEFTYKTDVPAVKKGEGPVDIFIPLAESDENQKVLQRKINSPIAGKIKKEDKYGNQFWHAQIADTDGKPLTVTVDYEVERKLHSQTELEAIADLNLTPSDLKRFPLFLQANKRVPIDGKLIEKVRKDVPKVDKNTPLHKARAIYDYVVDTMEYKKVGTGWGNGDTYWACNKRYGNCTDFHALFISLARAENIPSKFEIGFPIPESKAGGQIKGYHCWVNFYLPKVGWTPIDASEAAKNPAKKEMYFGTHPADRIKFTVGRDLELGEGHNSGPLNYFIYPHIEVAGKHVGKVPTEFRYKG